MAIEKMPRRADLIAQIDELKKRLIIAEAEKERAHMSRKRRREQKTIDLLTARQGFGRSTYPKNSFTYHFLTLHRLYSTTGELSAISDEIATNGLTETPLSRSMQYAPANVKI